MESFAPVGVSFAARGGGGLLASVRGYLPRVLRLARWRGAGAKNGGIAAHMDEIGALSRTLVQASMDAAENAGEQSRKVVALVGLEERIRASARLSLDNSKTAARMTEEVARDIDEGTRTIDATNCNMAEMVKTVATGAALMEKFVASIGEVNRVVSQIGGIARQTNLLALNAAIEASHAGAEGDGFNVIAQEIRLLANRASHATTEIGATIGEMSASAAAAGRAMQSGRTAAESSIEETVGVQRSLESMRHAMLGLLDLSKKVERASAGQLATGDEVSAIVDSVHAMVTGSAGAADAAAEMSIKMVGGAERVRAQLDGWPEGRAGRENKGRRAADRVLLQVENRKAAVLSALSMLRAECARAGPGIVHGTVRVKGEVLPGLRFGGVPASEAEPWVDSVAARTGCGATVFVFAGGQFVRVATNVKLPNGERATGTRLNVKGLADAALKQGKSFFGAVYVLGNPFVAGYEPVFSLQGTLIGALYAGRRLETESRPAIERAN